MPVDTCATCGGDGDIAGEMCTNCWGAGVTPLRGISAQVAALTSKVDDLQADMDIIKPQIQAIYDDLNP